MTKLEQAIAFFEDAIRESDEIIAECSEALQKELTEQKGHFETALKVMKMQREIKFRAWNKLEKRMESVNFIKFFQNAYTMVSTRYRDEKSKKLYDDQFAYGQEDGSDNVILMQYIGLKDKNGNEIYEGDIVTGLFDHTDIIGHIIYGSDATFFIYRKGLYRIGLNNAEDWLEVIGNIYENPELLKE